MKSLAALTVCALLLVAAAACEKTPDQNLLKKMSVVAYDDAMRVVILGPPGAGKGTQARRISENYKIPHISTGDMLRAEVAKNSAVGALAKEYMDKGELVPDNIVLKIVEYRLRQDDCRMGFILDGFPRTISQADGLAEIIGKYTSNTFKVINLNVPDEVLMGRMLSRGRADDTEETITNRIKVYHDQTTPLIDYYKRLGVLIDIDGDQTIEEVFESIQAELGTGEYEFDPELKEN